jgi:polyisoprenoid-binding protein YceI
MKKLILATLIISAMFASCKSKGEKAETKKAEKVEVVKTEKTNAFKNIKAGSHVAWRASHLGGVQPRFGKIFVKNAELLVNDGKVTNASFTMDMGSLTVESFPQGDNQKGKLTKHLKSPDFFNIPQFPTAKFEVTKVTGTNGDFNSIVTGNLTIKGVTKSISFKANVTVSGNEVVIKSKDFAVNRSDWGLTYNAKGTKGVPTNYLISDDVGFTIDVVLTK